jgi:hypothetical protein
LRLEAICWRFAHRFLFRRRHLLSGDLHNETNQAAPETKTPEVHDSPAQLARERRRFSAKASLARVQLKGKIIQREWKIAQSKNECL